MMRLQSDGLMLVIFLTPSWYLTPLGRGKAKIIYIAWEGSFSMNVGINSVCIFATHIGLFPGRGRVLEAKSGLQGRLE